jgi:hypothetical protein
MYVAVLLLLSILSLGGHVAVGPSGHWEGTIQAPGTDVTIEVDIARNQDGALAGALTNPSRHIKERPFAKVDVNGTSISFYAREDQSVATGNRSARK